MIRHFFITFLRTNLKSTFQLITIVSGLTIAMVVSLLIYIYVKEETSFDKHHHDHTRIFRVNTILEMEGKVDHTAKAGFNTGSTLHDHYSQIESSTQVLNVGKQTVRVGENLYATEQLIYAEKNFFDFFVYHLVKQADAMLDGPNKVVMSKQLAETYFGSIEKAFGAQLEINKQNFVVTGIFDDHQYRTHIPHKIFVSMETLPADFREQRNREFMWITTYSYIKVRNDGSINDLRAQIGSFYEKYLVPYVQKNNVNGSITFDFEPVANIHLDDKLRFDFPGAINPNYLKIFSIVGLLTMVIALMNYINLTTAKISKRIKETGIKKAIGASRSSLIMQFVGETIITLLVSCMLALVIAALVLPELNNLTDKELQIGDVINLQILALSVITVVGLGIIAGIYPAILLSALKPVEALQAGTKKSGSVATRFLNPAGIRKVLVTLQFAISVFLVIGTIVIFKQFNFLRSKDLGFDQNQVMVIDIPTDTSVSKQLDVIRNKLTQISGVKAVSSTSSIPGSGHGALTMNVSQSGGSEIKIINTYMADDQFVNALDIDVVDGRFFSKERSTDPQEAFIINESAAKFLGWEQPIGKQVESPLGQKGFVVGVIKDFNYKSLHSAIEPLIIMNSLNSQGYLLVKLQTDNFEEVISQVSDAWKAFAPAHPYEYFFLDEKFQTQYVKEQRLTKIFTYFSSLSIFICCLGLVGLAMFTNELKTKEIAIRKTLGASSPQIFGLLSREFLMLVVLANLIVWPIAYYFISDWLKQFAYQTEMNVAVFLLGGAISFLIAFATVAWFAHKATRQEIVKALKYN